MENVEEYTQIIEKEHRNLNFRFLSDVPSDSKRTKVRKDKERRLV